MTKGVLFVGIVIVIVVQAVKGYFSLIGKPIPPSLQFFLGFLTSLLGALGLGGHQGLTEFASTFAALFATVQALYNTFKRFWGLLRAVGV